MSVGPQWGYMGKILRVDLTAGSIRDEPLDQTLAELYLGGGPALGQNTSIARSRPGSRGRAPRTASSWPRGRSAVKRFFSQV